MWGSRSDTKWKVSQWSDKSKSEILLWNPRRRVLQAKTERKWLLSTADIHEGDLNDRTKQKHLRSVNIYDHRSWSLYFLESRVEMQNTMLPRFSPFVLPLQLKIKFQEQQLSINYLQKLNNRNIFYKAKLQQCEWCIAASLFNTSNIKTFNSTRISAQTFSISNFYQNTEGSFYTRCPSEIHEDVLSSFKTLIRLKTTSADFL